jgi:hypothetical protein
MRKKEVIPYIPSNAKLNLDNKSMEIPKVKYEERKWIIDRPSYKKIVEKK